MMTLSRSRMTKVSTDQRERLAMSVERLDQSSDKIRESRRTMMETEDLGVSVLQDLIITSKLLFVAGDLGQTFDSNITLPHYEKSPKKGQAVLFVGDLSYADNHPNHDNNRWDSWGRFSERSTAYQPWIWTTGNHELDFAPEIGKINRLSHSHIGTVLLTELQAAQNHSGTL
ncbi:unnamed protein product [Brassica napus]|uniref:acid phosphatase n=1 Tax=Brassica napus TaxID=3708 RepID=A0A816YTN7_BRANA|nr:unnamed protein product [Brassica napus]